jgi:hypothetical protein
VQVYIPENSVPKYVYAVNQKLRHERKNIGIFAIIAIVVIAVGTSSDGHLCVNGDFLVCG